MLEAILFDLDETLHSREAAFWKWIEHEAQQAPERQLDRSQVAALDARGRGDKLVLLQHLDDALGWRLTPSARMQRFRCGLAAKLELDERVRGMLARLAKRYRLGLVTNGTGETQRLKLQQLGLENVFDPVIISGEVGFKKPDERIFRLALERLGIPAHLVAFVGDHPITDIAGARAVGMVAVRVGGGGALADVVALEAWIEAYPPARAATASRTAGSLPHAP